VDLLSFDAEPLYFDNPPSEKVVQLPQQAAEDYSDGKAEADLQQAYQQAPEHLMVLVALFRYYYHQHNIKLSWHSIILFQSNALAAILDYRRRCRHVIRASLY
jgi:hypothetical protein